MPERRLAVVEMAAASGLPLLAGGERDPARATTFGTGQVVRAALDAGAKHLILGLGGSATSDGGAGFLRALGARLFDDRNRETADIGAVARVDLSGLDGRLRGLRVTLAADVDNPLLGPRGAVRVFGPQKGFATHDLPRAEAALGRFADALTHAAGRDCRDAPGAGAAGGLGFGLMAALGAGAVEMRSGLQVISELAGLAGLVADADLVVTGEGRLDKQSLSGKAPVGVARLGRDCGTPVIAFAGSVVGPPELFEREGLRLVVPIVEGPMSLEDAVVQAAVLLRRAARRTLQGLILGGELAGRK